MLLEQQRKSVTVLEMGKAKQIIKHEFKYIHHIKVFINANTYKQK